MKWLKEKALVWILKWSGAGKAWELLDGKKTYLSGAASILSGASQWLQSIVALDGWQGALELLKGAPDHPGTLAILLGWGLIGLGHKADKAKK